MLLASVNSLKKYYQDKLILDINKFEIFENDRIGLVGINGAGKSTLLKALAGQIDIDEGSVFLTNSYSYISQIENEYDVCVDTKIKSLLNSSDEFKDYLSGGEKTKIKITKALSEKRKLIIADEPTSNLDKKSVDVLKGLLQDYKGAILIVSHDRSVLDLLCTTIAEIEDGKLKLYSGNYSTYLELKEKEVKRKTFEYESYISEKKRLERVIIKKREFKDSIRKAPKRMGNSEARLHKMGDQRGKKNIETNINAVKTRIDKLEKKEKPKGEYNIKIYIQDDLKIKSKNLIEVKDLTLKKGDRVLLENASFKVKNNKKICILGENGIGKSSLLKEIMMHSFKRDSNDSIRINSNVKIGYFDQNQDILDENKSILENIKFSSSFDETFIRINLSLLGFVREDVFKKVSVLSGGEKIKVAICKILLEDNNLLMLDEPTNYLDIVSIKALETALMMTDKTMILVSHDTLFVSNICDYVIEIKDKGIIEFNGDLASYEARNFSKKLECNKNDILILENKISSILSLLSIEIDSAKKELLEEEFKLLLKEKKEKF